MFWSEKLQMGIQILSKEMDTLYNLCKESPGKETGGVLLGNYTDDLNWACITDILPAPKDSKSGSTWFRRGTKGVQAKVDAFWKKRKYYLGEWHYHPAGDPNPSEIDDNQMIHISNASQYHCPEPILLIISRTDHRLQQGWYIFRENRRFPLHEIKRYNFI